MMLDYRDATNHDLSEIVEIYNSTVSSRMVTADTEPVSVESRQRWFNEHHPKSRPLWVVEDEKNRIIGWVSFQSFYGRPAYISTAEISIYLKEEERGKGYGKMILSYSIEKAAGFGIKTLLGYIFSHNTPSLRLFEKLGFETWGILPRIAVLDGQEKGLTIVGKRIA